MIPICDLRQQYQELQHELERAMLAVAASGHYILGPQTRELEREAAEYLGCQHVAGVANGTDALHLALRALDIGPGDEVITTPFTFIATTEAIGLVGACPVFVDIHPETFNLDPEGLERAITERTRAILPVHLYGQPCDMRPILALAREHNLAVVEDCAQAIGAAYGGQRVGTLGDIGCFSFFPSKNLGAFGDGGMVSTNSPRLYARIDKLRRHGGDVKYHHSELGMNSRLDEMQAAILRVKLPHLEQWTEQRRAIAYRYNQLLADDSRVKCPSELGEGGASVPQPGGPANPMQRSVYHQYTIQAPDRDRVSAEMSERGVSTMIYYPIPLHLQEVHQNLGLGPGAFPVSEALAARCLSLPMFPELRRDQQDQVVQALKASLPG